jgi:hypothetical protein
MKTLFITGLMAALSSVASADPILVVQPSTRAARVSVAFTFASTNCAGFNLQGLQAYPEVGSVVRLANTGTGTLVIEAYSSIDRVKLPGYNVTQFTPQLAPALEGAPDFTPAISRPYVFQILPGQSVDAVIPQPSLEPGVETNVGTRCQELEAFRKRPKFSYGAQVNFNTGI